MATVTPPLVLTDVMLTSSTAAEPGVGEQAFAIGTTYALNDEVILGSPTSTVTISIAAPGVVTWAAHGLADATPVALTTTGALPTGLTAGTIYYIVNSAPGTFQLSATPDGAAITTTGSQSGTHTATAQVHRTYRSLQAGNVGHSPPLTASATWWQDIGPTNRWAMLDVYRNTPTWQASPLTVVLTPGVRVDTIFLGGLVASGVTITVTSGGPTVYTDTIDLSTRTVLNWYDYFFKPFSFRVSVLRTDLPPYTNAIITVAITRTSGLVGCGSLVLGTNVYIGATQHGAEASADNFSTITRDVFGNATLVQRRTVPTANLTVWCDKSLIRNILDLQVIGNAEPMVYSGLDDDTHDYFEPILVLGVYKGWVINLAHAAMAIQSMQLEEV